MQKKLLHFQVEEVRMKFSEEESVTEEEIQPVQAKPEEETKRQGVRELVHLLNQQAADAQTNQKPKSPPKHKTPSKREDSPHTNMKTKSKSPEKAERCILHPMREWSSPSPDRLRAQRSPTKHFVDIASPREGSPVPRSTSVEEKPFLTEIYENPKRRPLDDIIRQFSVENEPGTEPRPSRAQRRPQTSPAQQRSHSSPPLRRPSRMENAGTRGIPTREGSPPRFGERLGQVVSVVDDDMFRNEGSIRMKRGKGKKIGWTDRTDESGDSLDNLDDEKGGRGRSRKRGSRNSPDKKDRSSSRSSGSDGDGNTPDPLRVARSKSPVFETFEGQLLASTPIGPLSPDHLSPARAFCRDDTRRKSYDEASLLADKELKSAPNFELRRKAQHKPRGKKKEKARPKRYPSSNESEQDASLELGSELDTRSEASSIDMAPVAGVSAASADAGASKQKQSALVASSGNLSKQSGS